jgi:hydroxyethylthiazole kinase-like uncharacterized protein yjeF
MPLPVITSTQMREWENATWATGQTEAEVIHRVGEVVAQHALRLTKPGDLLLILAGKGHNGDDARAALQHLADRRLDLLNVQDPSKDLPQLETSLSQRPDLIIDGLFGIGINRTFDVEWRQFIERVNVARAFILAVDVPSGLHADTGEPQGAAIRAAVTLTVGAPKIGFLQPQAWDFVGRLEVADRVGLIPCPFQTELNWTLLEDFIGFPPRRPVASHKGTHGHLAILAGSVGYHGAAVLAARGAQRAQPGLVTLHTIEKAYVPVAAQLQAVMVAPWPSPANFSEHYNALVAGPGLAATDVPDDLKTSFAKTWSKSSLAVLTDASALSWLPPGEVPQNAIRVITPHPGEAARLLETEAKVIQANRLDALRRLSKKFGDTWVVLKGHQTLFGRSTGPVFVNSSGNPHLAQGGSGDTLSGYLGGLLAQPTLQSDLLTTIRYAVWQHGAAADLLQATKPGWVVEDLVAALGSA